jgi:hypothetical protein
MNLVNHSDGWFNSQILITKNMRKKEFNYFARLVFNVKKIFEIMLKT